MMLVVRPVSIGATSYLNSPSRRRGECEEGAGFGFAAVLSDLNPMRWLRKLRPIEGQPNYDDLWRAIDVCDLLKGRMLELLRKPVMCPINGSS